MEEQDKEITVESVAEAKRDNRRFIATVFIVASILSLSVAFFYWWLSPSADKGFHLIVIVAAGGITIPMFISTMRLMLKGYYLSLMGWESTRQMVDGYRKLQEEAKPIVKNVEKVVDKAVPIAENVADVVARSRGMAEDIEAIAHRIRGMVDSVNGAFDFKVVESHLRETKEHLATLAGAFSFPRKKKKKGGGGDDEGGTDTDDFPMEIDPFQGGGRRKK